MIRNEYANPFYTTDFMRSLFEEEGGDLFDVRQAILGHLQQGGDPSPFDRIQATRLAAKCMEYLIDAVETDQNPAVCIGLKAGRVQFSNLSAFPDTVEMAYQRPRDQWWLALRHIARMLAQPTPSETS